MDSYAYSNSTVAIDPAATFFVWAITIPLAILMYVAVWRLFTKAGKPGWASLIPIYNIIVMLEIVGRPVWWVLLMFVPIANLVVTILLYIDFAKAYGKDGGFAALLILLPIIGFPMLAFGSSRYVGPVAAGGAMNTPVSRQ